MQTLYKLTTQDNKTRKGEYNETIWGDGVSHSGTGKGLLCSPGWIHAYTSPLLAVLLNPIHADIKDPKLWECKGEIALSDKGLKVGCKILMTIREIELPKVTTMQHIAFGILCANQVFRNAEWNAWADKWLSGKDRGARARDAALATARGAANAAANAAAFDLIRTAEKAMKY